MNKIIIALSIVLAILIGLLIFFMAREKSETENVPTEPDISTVETLETEATEETEIPTETAPTETEVTEDTKETEPATEDTTEESKLPDVSTEPVEGEKSGQFTSGTGTGLDLVVDWTTYSSSDGTKMVRFDISLSTFSIYVGSREDGIKITMDGITKAIDSDAVSYPKGGKTKILIGSCSMEMSGAEADVEVSWDFRGTYGDVAMEQVTASGHISR